MSSGSLTYAVRTPQVVHETVDGEVVAVDFTTGSYYSLRGAAGEIWGALDGGATVEEVLATLSHAYDPSALEEPVAAFLDQLVAEGLVVTAPGTAVNGAHRGSGTAELGELGFEKFTDMEEIILLDPVHDVSASGWPHAAEADADPTA